MPLFLLRDGSIRNFTVVPEGLEFVRHHDRRRRAVHVLLDADSERRLLAAQPSRRRVPSRAPVPGEQRRAA